MSDKPSRRQIVESLQNGDRDPVGDADRVDDLEDFDVEAIHHGRDGTITLQFSLRTAYEATIGGGIYDFDITEDYDA